jgi:hypothetical protein
MMSENVVLTRLRWAHKWAVWLMAFNLCKAALLWGTAAAAGMASAFGWDVIAAVLDNLSGCVVLMFVARSLEKSRLSACAAALPAQGGTALGKHVGWPGVSVWPAWLLLSVNVIGAGVIAVLALGKTELDSNLMVIALANAIVCLPLLNGRYSDEGGTLLARIRRRFDRNRTNMSVESVVRWVCLIVALVSTAFDLSFAYLATGYHGNDYSIHSWDWALTSLSLAVCTGTVADEVGAIG